MKGHHDVSMRVKAHTFINLFTLNTGTRISPPRSKVGVSWIEAPYMFHTLQYCICLTADLNDINVYADFGLWVLMRIKVSSHSESKVG